MAKKQKIDKKHQHLKGTHFTSEFLPIRGEGPGTKKDFVGIQVVQPTNPNHRPDYRVSLVRTEISMKEVLRASDKDDKLLRITVPEEEIVYGGDLRVDAISVANIDADKLCAIIKQLQARQEQEMAEWVEQKKERKRENRRRYQRRRRARKRAEAEEKRLKAQEAQKQEPQKKEAPNQEVQQTT